MKRPSAPFWFRSCTPLRAPFRTLSLALLLATGPVVPVRADDMPPHATAAGDHDDAGPRGERLRDLMATLSPAGQKVMEEDLARAMARGRPHRGELMQLRREIGALMRADRFDAEALRRAFARERALAEQVQTAHHERVIATLSRLSPADRKAMASWIDRKREHRRFRRGSDDGPGPRDER